ncbi:hypothetical protein ACOME3_002023 [Neoechinorhynchus agilis]
MDTIFQLQDDLTLMEDELRGLVAKVLCSIKRNDSGKIKDDPYCVHHVEQFIKLSEEYLMLAKRLNSDLGLANKERELLSNPYAKIPLYFMEILLLAEEKLTRLIENVDQLVIISDHRIGIGTEKLLSSAIGYSRKPYPDGERGRLKKRHQDGYLSKEEFENVMSDIINYSYVEEMNGSISSSDTVESDQQSEQSKEDAQEPRGRQRRKGKIVSAKRSAKKK